MLKIPRKLAIFQTMKKILLEKQIFASSVARFCHVILATACSICAFVVYNFMVFLLWIWIKIYKIPKILTILECLPWCVILKSEIVNKIVYHKCGILYYICCVVYCICSIVYYICGIHKWDNWGKFQKCYFHLEFWKESFRF